MRSRARTLTARFVLLILLAAVLSSCRSCWATDPLSDAPEYFIGFAPRGGAPILDANGQEIGRFEGGAFILRDQCVVDANGQVRIAAGGRGDGWVLASELEFCPRRPDSDALEQELRRRGIVERLTLTSSEDGTMLLSWSDSPYSEHQTRYRCTAASPLPVAD